MITLITTDYLKVTAMELFIQTVDIRRLFPTHAWPGIEPFLSLGGEPLLDMALLEKEHASSYGFPGSYSSSLLTTVKCIGH